MAGVDFRGFQASSGQDGRVGGGGAMRRTATAWGLAQFGREVFCPQRPLEVVQNRCRRVLSRPAAAELAPSVPKVIVGAKTFDPKGDAYCGS